MSTTLAKCDVPGCGYAPRNHQDATAHRLAHDRDAGLYGSREVMEATGITFRQLDYWVRTGVIKPSAQEASGSGTRRVFTENDVRAIRTLVALLAIRAPRPGVLGDVFDRVQRGEHGTFELRPGVLLDLEVLARGDD